MGVSRDQLLALKALIEDEEGPYFAMESDEERKAALEAKSIVEHPRVAMAEVQRILMASGEWWAIKSAAATNPHAEMTMDMLGAMFDDLDVHHATTQGVFDALQAASLLSAESRASIEALGTVYRSPAEVAGIGPKVRIGWFDRARVL